MIGPVEDAGAARAATELGSSQVGLSAAYAAANAGVEFAPWATASA